MAGPYSPLPPAQVEALAMPANLTGVWPPAANGESGYLTVERASNSSRRPPAPTRIDMDFWRTLRVVKNHL